MPVRDDRRREATGETIGGLARLHITAGGSVECQKSSSKSAAAVST